MFRGYFYESTIPRAVRKGVGEARKDAANFVGKLSHTQIEETVNFQAWKICFISRPSPFISQKINYKI